MISNLTVLAGGIVLGTRSRDIELFLILTLIIDAVSGLLILLKFGPRPQRPLRPPATERDRASGSRVRRARWSTYLPAQGRLGSHRGFALCLLPLSLVALLASGSAGRCSAAQQACWPCSCCSPARGRRSRESLSWRSSWRELHRRDQARPVGGVTAPDLDHHGTRPAGEQRARPALVGGLEHLLRTRCSASEPDRSRPSRGETLPRPQAVVERVPDSPPRDGSPSSASAAYAMVVVLVLPAG